jgi:hypothetical protein
MPLSRPLLRAGAALAAALLGACASPEHHAIFVTKTSLAVLDADTAPASVSIAYDRTEAYVGPRFSDGQVAPVAGSIETDGRIFNRRIRQVYATGDAARFATTPVGVPLPAATPQGQATDPASRVMVFGTSTSLGLKLGFVEGTVLPNSFTLGYRRKEASVIPVEPGLFPSVIGVLQSDVDAAAADGARPEPAFGLAQLFATGEAAATLAQREDVRRAFTDRTAKAIDPLQVYRSEEARQGRAVLDLLACLGRLPDDRLARVWNNAEDLGVFESAGLPTALARVRAATTPAAQRAAYTDDISLLNADAAAHTAQLLAHKDAVCRLARR